MEALKIRSEAMLGTTHSWAVTMRSLLHQFDKLGHDLFLKSINGYGLFPKDWNAYKRSIGSPDIDITYTLPRNFGDRFSSGSKLKLAIYNYETSKMPEVWKDQINYIDYALPSSNFSKEVFVNAGWPEDRCIVIPHGINPEDFEDKSKADDLKTKKSFKFLNVSIPHYRKNIGLLVDAYYSEFTDNDDVCLVLKTSLKKPKYKFECDVTKEIVAVQKRHRGRRLPQIEISQKRYDSMVPLYNACDCLVSATSAEGFGLPLLEALAAKMVVVAPRASGQLDFLNDSNSLLVDTQVIEAPDRYQYWRPTSGATTHLPEKEHLALQMRSAYSDFLNIKNRISAGAQSTVSEFTWENAARKILDIA